MKVLCGTGPICHILATVNTCHTGENYMDGEVTAGVTPSEVRVNLASKTVGVVLALYQDIQDNKDWVLLVPQVIWAVWLLFVKICLSLTLIITVGRGRIWFLWSCPSEGPACLTISTRSGRLCCWLSDQQGYGKWSYFSWVSLLLPLGKTT